MERMLVEMSTDRLQEFDSQYRCWSSGAALLGQFCRFFQQSVDLRIEGSVILSHFLDPCVLIRSSIETVVDVGMIEFAI